LKDEGAVRSWEQVAQAFNDRNGTRLTQMGCLMIARRAIAKLKNEIEKESQRA
jgi:hypothetical protein